MGGGPVGYMLGGYVHTTPPRPGAGPAAKGQKPPGPAAARVTRGKKLPMSNPHATDSQMPREPCADATVPRRLKASASTTIADDTRITPPNNSNGLPVGDKI